METYKFSPNMMVLTQCMKVFMGQPPQKKNIKSISKKLAPVIKF